MFAVIRSGGKQHQVALGEIIKLDKINADQGSVFETKEILLINKEGSIKIGTPLVEGASVKGTILNQVQGKKVIIFKRRRRKGYRRKNGHRQDYTLVKISSIEA